MFRSSLLALLLGGLAAGTPSTRVRASTAAGADARFPSVDGVSLEGEHFRLPSDLKGELNVVFVMFKREQQVDVDTWTPFLRLVGESRRDLRVYELPTVGRRYRLLRPVIDEGMRRAIPKAALRAATITLYTDKESFRDALGLPNEDGIYALIVDRSGRVLGRTDGRFTEERGMELVRRLDEARANGRTGV